MSVPVIYIAGSGRSGTTLLGQLLGQVTGICFVGELDQIWQISLDPDHLCGCGRPFRSCAFWSAVIKRVFGNKGLSERDVEAIVELKRRATRLRYVPYLESNRHPQRYREQVREYGAILSNLYQAIEAESGCRIIVDSSKLTSNGFLLKSLETLDLRVLHLIRDSRAIAYSNKRGRRDSAGYLLKADLQPSRFKAAAQGAEWSISNAGAYALRRRSSLGLQVKYESFASSPMETVSKALMMLAPELHGDNYVEPSLSSGTELATTHTVTGNSMRFETGPLRIEEDIEWKSQLAPYHFYLVTFLTFPLLKAFGYPLRIR